MRQRLIEGLGKAVSAHGYSAATISDVVRHAHVSKRTFYEHFADKDDCFLAAYSEASAQILTAIAAVVDPAAPWEEQIRAAVLTYLAGLQSRPALARAFLLEIQAAGPRALKARRQVHERFAEQIQAFAEQARRRTPALQPLSPELAAAVVGGINELVLLRLEAGARLTDLAESAYTFAHAVLTAGTARRR